MAPKRQKQNQGEASSSSAPPKVNLNVNFGARNAHKKARFMALKKRPLIVTKFPFAETLNKFGMWQGVEKLLTKGGLEGLLSRGATTWTRPTLEFLASVERAEKQGQPAISFQLMGEKKIMTYAEVALAFGWEVGGENWNPPNDLVTAAFWQDLSGVQYKGRGGNKVNTVIHPCFRYVLRLLNNTVFLNGEIGGVTLSEIRHFWALAPEGVGKPPWVELFVTRCLLEQGKDVGKISFGGMVTLLAGALGVEITADCGQVQPTAGIYLDDGTLRKVKFLDYDSGIRPNFRYLIKGAADLHLPPYPANQFDIPDNASTYALRRQFFGLGAFQEESDDNEEEEPGAEGEEEGDGGFDPWRQQVDHRLGLVEEEVNYMREDIQALRGEICSHRETVDAGYNTIESQFARLFTYQDSMMDYFSRVGGANFQDPRQAAQDEAWRQEQLRRQFEEQQRRFGPGSSG